MVVEGGVREMSAQVINTYVTSVPPSRDASRGETDS
jgi:hypothetical protein